MNYSRIRFVLNWLKGVKLDIPHSKFVMFAIGVYILVLAFAKGAEAMQPYLLH